MTDRDPLDQVVLMAIKTRYGCARFLQSVTINTKQIIHIRLIVSAGDSIFRISSLAEFIT